MLVASGVSTAAHAQASEPAPAEDGAVALDGIDVVGQMLRGWQGASDAIYETPASVAEIGREAIEARGGARNAADLFRGVAGVDAVMDRQNPGVNVNIRGLQDQGRVNMSIDGARQNFQQSGHGATSLVYLDPELLSRIEIEKGPTSTAGGAGVIGGVVTFRTLEFEDLATDGKDWGARVNATTGSNAFDFNGSLAAATKIGDAFEVVAGVGRKKLGEYKAGTRGELVYSGAGEPAEFTTQDQWSWLLKARADVADDQQVKLTYTGVDAKFGTGDGQYTDTNKVTTHNVIADYRWAPADGAADLNAKVYFTRTENAQHRPARTTYGAFDVDYGIDTIGASLSNVTRFSVPMFDAAWTYGGEYFRDKTTTASFGADPTDNPDGSWFYGSNPVGKRGVGGVFTNLELNHGQFLQIIAGGRYDRYDMTGDTVRFDGISNGVPVAVDKSGGRFSPTATVAITPVTGAQVYASYKQGYRPPNLMEALIGGQHIGGGIFSVPNPDLKPELSETWEAGLNLKYDGVLAEGDAFRAKLAVYTTDVRNFITLAAYEGFRLNTAVNLKDKTRLKGFDAEANYDAGSFYVGGAASFLNGRYGDDYDLPDDATGFLTNIYLPPKRKLSLDGGLRFLDRKLTVGGRATNVVPEDNLGAFGTYQYKRYTLLDAYASYKFNDTFTVRASVENIRNVAYVEAMSSALSPSPGRTFTVGASARF
ncbi:TonB-dependent hemoglobin/transferrin/lactoferrin family receptor [Chenggangzhangella methanolivorans]|uniref:TonB-dependent hemoglobin/transferrin/lactoferrin family receptor n=1 Tax=Chenggangzhangella methanolivorans TaxID=1437009 RepID=UPI0021BD3197|nr:TonB-dependent hemoglobin/transferrin/lactoferrin family receptor [Chenggangzhangella methanolivorans]